MKKLISVWVFILFILISFLTLSLFLKVPTFLKGSGILMNNSVIDFISEREGVISYVKKNDSYVKKGDVLLVYDNLANTESVLKLDSIISSSIKSNVEIQDLFDLNEKLNDSNFENLGEINSAYIEFKTQLNKFFIIKNSKINKYENESIQERINVNTLNINGVDNEVIIHLKNKLDVSENSFRNDSILLYHNLLTIDEFNNSKNIYIQSKINYNNALKSLNLDKKSNTILSIEKEKVFENYKINTNIEYNNVIEKHLNLVKSIQSWKYFNLITSPIEGKISFYRYWNINQYINKNEQLFIIQSDNEFKDIEIKINVAGAGKIEKGQECIIELEEYPSNDYGLLKGNVKNVINLKHKDKNEIYSTYIKISLTNGGKTNQNKTVPISHTMPLTAEIIIDNEILFNKIFKRFKKEFTPKD